MALNELSRDSNNRPPAESDSSIFHMRPGELAAAMEHLGEPVRRSSFKRNILDRVGQALHHFPFAH